MKIWVVVREDKFRVTIVGIFDTKEEAEMWEEGCEGTSCMETEINSFFNADYAPH